MWVVSVVGSLSGFCWFFYGYSGFPLSPKTNISKFQFDQRIRETKKHFVDRLPLNSYSFIYLYSLGEKSRTNLRTQRQKSNRFRLTKQQLCTCITLSSFSFHMERCIFPEKEKDPNRFAKNKKTNEAQILAYAY